MTTAYRTIQSHKKAFFKRSLSYEILDGEFKGVVFQFDNVKIDEIKEEGLDIAFNFVIIDNPLNAKADEERIGPTIGYIMESILKEFLEEHGTNHTSGVDV
jgi:hypothetical protein